MRIAKFVGCKPWELDRLRESSDFGFYDDLMGALDDANARIAQENRRLAAAKRPLKPFLEL